MGSVRLAQPRITALLTNAIHQEGKLTGPLLQKTMSSISMHIRADQAKPRSAVPHTKPRR